MHNETAGEYSVLCQNPAVPLRLPLTDSPAVSVTVGSPRLLEAMTSIEGIPLHSSASVKELGVASLLPGLFRVW